MDSLGEGIQSVISTISNIPSMIIEGIKGIFLELFTLEDDYFTTKFNDYKDSVSNKFLVSDIINLFESIKNVASSGFPNVTVTIYGVTVDILDFTFINTHLNTIHSWIRGFFFIFLGFYNYNQLYRLIRGTSLIDTTIVDNSNGVQMDMFGGMK